MTPETSGTQAHAPAQQSPPGIRKQIVADDNMSLNARNVKIITTDGRVNLRGTVDSAQEKRMIGEIADRVVRAENVDNQLEVKLPAITTSRN